MLPYAVIVIVGGFANSVLAQFFVNTPTNAVACQPLLLSWSGGTPPYYVSIYPSGQPTASPLETIASAATATSFTWTVNIAVGTSVMVDMRDATGSAAYSAPFTILAGTSTSCLANAGGSASSSTVEVSSAVASVASSGAAASSSAIAQYSASAVGLFSSTTAITSESTASVASTEHATTPTSQMTSSTSATGTTGGLVAQTNAIDSSSSGKSSSKTIAIAAGVVAGVLAIAVAVLVHLLVRRNRRRRHPRFDVDPSPVGQRGGSQPGIEVPQAYHAESAFLPFVPASAGQVTDDSIKAEQPQTSSQSDVSPPYPTSSQMQTPSPSQPQQQQPQSSPSPNSASSSGATSSSQLPHLQHILGGGLVPTEKSSLPGLPPGASPPIFRGMGSTLMGGSTMAPDASMYHPVGSPPPRYES